MKRTSRFLALLLSAVMLLALAGCGGKDTTPAPQPSDGDAAGEAIVYPADLLNYYVAASAGGGLDIVSRAFTNQWEDALGTTFEYIYEDTGNTYLMALNDLGGLDEDEFGVICGLPEAMLGMFAFQDSPYTVDDIAWIGNVYTDANCLMVRIDDDRFNSAQDLIDYARTASSPIAISTPQALTPANITAQIFVEASGINANVVTYSGGSGARNDLIGGHVDVSVGGISTAVGLADQVKIIGIFGENNPVTDIWPDAQVVSDFATDFEMPDLTCHCSIWTTKAMAERNPEVYQMLVDIYSEEKNPGNTFWGTGKGFDFAQVADATLSLFDLIAAQEAGETIDCGDAIAIYQAALDQQTALLKDAIAAETGAIQGITAMLG